MAVHEHAAQAMEGQRGNTRSGSCPRHPEQVQGEREQDEGDQNDHRRHHRFRTLLDSSPGFEILFSRTNKMMSHFPEIYIFALKISLLSVLKELFYFALFRKILF